MAYRSNRRRTVPKRRMFWVRYSGLFQYNSEQQAAIGDMLSQFQADYGADLFGFTVTRIRGYYTFWAPNQPDVTTSANLSLGIRIGTENAVPATDAEQAELIPINDEYADWMYTRNNLLLMPGSTSLTPTPSEQAMGNRVELDLKAQRRLDEMGQSLFLFAGVNAPIEPDTDTELTAWWDFNILCKRP